MKKIEIISRSNSYSAVNIGDLNSLQTYSFLHPKTGQEIKGKVFLKEPTKATGTEISFQTLSPRSELSYFHKHIENEETYIILKGSGFFQVDEDCFPVKEGSVVRITPAAKRGFCNTSDDQMILVVIQSKEGSLNQYSSDDGERVIVEPKWRNK
uniref:cupin domain-containing protein n=1 Tax=uncultured Dysgonomonas sp. TaxID=206096 RepID=UPI0026352462|nr:cupin domain-containing protein [uncultured Dysgonomonas sp.]